ncbi:MAG: DUF5658 family protein [Phycisphaerales bacterium]
MPTPTCAAIGAPTHATGAPTDGATRSDRARRVTLLVVTAALLGLFDLLHTLSYMGGAGMMELNPVARAMIDLGGARQLILFKMFTIATSCGILYILRRYRQAEICAWISLAALAMLAAHWINYNGHVIEVAAFADATAFASDPRWVALD